VSRFVVLTTNLMDASRVQSAVPDAAVARSLLDENLTMAARWQAAGNSTKLQIYPGVPHAFSNFPIPIADQAIDNIQSWTNKQLSAKRT